MRLGRDVFFLSPHTPVGRVRLARFARVRLLRHALPISLLILRKKPTILQSTCRHDTALKIETLRFEDENNYEDEICLEFFVYSQKIYTPESFLAFFFPPEKLALFLKEVKLSPDRKMIKLLTFDNLLFPSLRYSRQNS